MARRAPTPVDARGIPDKPFFKIGETAKLTALPAYTLRYWETEFRSLKPQKTKSGQRLYRRKDVELLLRIRELVHDRGMTHEGVRSMLREGGLDEAAPAPVPAPLVDRKTLVEIKQEIEAILALVE